MLGKTFNKAKKWLGKNVPKAVNAVEKANNWLGKEIKVVKKAYSDLKEDVIKSSGVFRPLVREAITDIETSPLGQFVSSAVKQVEMRQQQADDVIQSGKAVTRFMGS